MVVLFWIIAALIVAWAEGTLGYASPIACVAVKTCAIIMVAFAYMKLTTRQATLDHALFVGVTWLVLAIVAEIVETGHLGHDWFELLGSPDSGLRNVLIISWIVAPALFARQREGRVGSSK